MKYKVKNTFIDLVKSKKLQPGDTFETNDKDRVEWAIKANVIHAEEVKKTDDKVLK